MAFFMTKHMIMLIRSIEQQDLSALKKVLDTINLFPSEYLEAMTADYLTDPDSAAIWMTAVEEGQPIALAYAMPEQFTEGTYNLLAIGVQKTAQSRGIGQQLIKAIEQELRQAKQRLLIIDTSSNLPDNLHFYKKCGYTQEAVIRDFWADGDDKVTFWKRL